MFSTVYRELPHLREKKKEWDRTENEKKDEERAKRKKKGRGEIGKERGRRLSWLPSFSACTLPASLLRADGPSCLSVFELHPAAEAGNRLAMLSKGEGCSDQCKQASGDKFLQTNGNLPLDPHQLEVTQGSLFTVCPLKGNIFSCLG